MNTQPLSLKDFFKTIASSFNPANIPVPTINSLASRTNTLPQGTGTYQSPTISPTPNMSVAPPAVVGPVQPSNSPVVSKKPITPVKAPIFTGNTPSSAPVTAPASLDYSKYTNPATGKPYTPEEYAQVVAKRVSGGDVASYAGDALANPNMSTAELTRRGTTLNNERNDIAVGEKDPYGVASESGIQYTPSELSAIEKAYAGVYDPALKDVFTKLDLQKKKDDEAQKAKEQLAQSELDNKNKLEQMKVQFEYDKKLKAIAPAGGTNASSNQKIDNERAAQTLFQNNPIVKDYNTVIGQKNSLDRIVANGVGGPADVNAIFNFMKALDPNSVVRESEYDKAAASGNLFQGAFAKFNGYFKDKGGFLPDNVRNEFQNLVNQKLEAQKVAYDNVASQTRQIVQRQGLNPDNVVIDFSGGIQNLTPNVVTAPDGSQVQITD